MPERFHDMVLGSIRLGDGEPARWWFFLDGERQVAIAQHAADMAHEIVCPCDCHLSDVAKSLQGSTLADAWLCPCCSGTGRVTLGSLVAADRARQARST